jgi:replicative DNA helicase
LPVSHEAERAVLGAILLQNHLWDEAAEFLTGEEFALDSHRRIWNRMRDLHESNRPIDMLLMTEELDKHKEIEAIGGVAYLSSLIDGLVERPSIKHYVEIVRNKALLRGIINVSQTAIAEAIEHSEEAEEVLARAELAISQLSETVIERKWSTFADSVDAAGGLDGFMSSRFSSASLTGIPTGYEDLDRMTGGLKKSELTIIAARPSVGKSSFICNIAENMLLREDGIGKVVAVFSLEMSSKALETRLLASAGRVSVRRAMGSGFLSPDEQKRLTEALGAIMSSHLFIDDSSYLTPIRLRSKCRQLKRKEGRLDLAIVDYLQLMAGGAKFENRTQEVSAISRSLKALAKDLDCPVVALSQLSRNVEGRSDKTPILSDLRESGSLEQDSDVVLLLHRPEMYSNDADLQGLAEINVAKNRDGATGRLQLAWIADYTRFENLARVT